MTYELEKSNLYPLQDKVLAKVFKQQKDWAIPNVILCGGTALARCYLHHRMSFDLDFYREIRNTLVAEAIALQNEGA